MYMLKHRACGTVFYVNPPVMGQKRTRCIGCQKWGTLRSNGDQKADYITTDRHGFSRELGEFLKTAPEITEVTAG